MAAVPFYMNIWFWIIMAFVFLILFGILFFLFIFISFKTHMIAEFNASKEKSPYGIFYRDDGYCEWKAIKPESGIVVDKDYGPFFINDRETYVDKRTKAIFISFDASIGANNNAKIGKIADELKYMITDEEQIKNLRYAIANNLIDENETINAFKTNINFGVMKTMMTALSPHNINSKIEKIIAERLKKYGQVNMMQIVILFGAVLGIILLGTIIVKMVLK